MLWNFEMRIVYLRTSINLVSWPMLTDLPCLVIWSIDAVDTVVVAVTQLIHRVIFEDVDFPGF